MNIEFMHRIDEIYTRYPYDGSRRIRTCLRRQDDEINRKRIQRVMRKMEIAAMYPKPKLSQANREHHMYPYLLRELVIDRPNQVWCTDITSIRLVGGFVYLVAVMDWYSRYVLSWAVSTTMETIFCREALEEALEQARPTMFNSDQGSQFTSQEFTNCLKQAGIAISMDGRGRCYDNIFHERLWRSVKYENVCLSDWCQVKEAESGLVNILCFIMVFVLTRH